MLYYLRSCIIQTNVTGLRLCTFADAALYPSRGQQRTSAFVETHEFLWMQPYTPHGDSNRISITCAAFMTLMQPYTPHGDSNLR